MLLNAVLANVCPLQSQGGGMPVTEKHLTMCHNVMCHNQSKYRPASIGISVRLKDTLNTVTETSGDIPRKSSLIKVARP